MMNSTHKSIFVLLFIAFFLCAGKVYSQSSEKVKELSYRAYAEGQLYLWEEAANLIEQEYTLNKNISTLYEYLLVQDGYIAFCVSNKQKKQGLEMLKKGNAYLEILFAQQPDNPNAIALKASFTAFEMNLSPAKMISLGPEAIKLTDKAYNAAPNSLMPLLVKANQLRFSPGLFGGSVDKAIPLYHKIINMYDSDKLSAQKDWRYINTMVILAGSYEKIKNYTEACKVYEKIISVDKDINWITNSLYPDCLENVK